MYLIVKKDESTVKPSAHLRPTKSLLEILPTYGNFFREIMILIGFSDCFVATPEFEIFSENSIMMDKVVRNLAKS